MRLDWQSTRPATMRLKDWCPRLHVEGQGRTMSSIKPFRPK